MTNEEAIKRLEKIRAIYLGMDNKSDVKALDMAVQALEQTDGDLISRDFMKKLDATCIAKRSETGELVAISSIDNLPSAENTAEWSIVGKTTLHYECSKCGGAGDEWDKFCKHCGRFMQKGVKE